MSIKDAVRIGEDWDSFLNEHPEVTVKKSCGKIRNINLPSDATHVTYLISKGKVVFLEYCLNDIFIRYSCDDIN